MASMKYAYLLFVDPKDNHNKFYEMRQTSSNTWEAKYGRVGVGTPQTKSYSMDKWGSKYREKVNKGYGDRTDEHVGVGEEKLISQKILKADRHKQIEDSEIRELVSKLISVSAQAIQEAYTIELNNVTEYMLNKAQNSLDNLYMIVEMYKESTGKSDKELIAELDSLWSKVTSALGRKVDFGSENPQKLHIEKLSDAEKAYSLGLSLVSRYDSLLTPTVKKNIMNNLGQLHEVGSVQVREERKRESRSVQEFNEELITLFNILPRRMRKVQDYLAYSARGFDNILRREQNTFDVMQGAYESKKRKLQLSANLLKDDDNNSMTVLEENGLVMKPCTADEIAEIKGLLGEISNKFSRAWRVENVTTGANYKKCLHDLNIDGRGIKKLWHGSTTENWWSILTNGLTIKPNARVTGKMFGNGIYFAPKARKSLGYTSISGSYWASGRDNVGYMGVFEVACGKPWDVTSSNGRFYNFGFKDLRGGCTYVYAHAGQVLRNDEIIVYRDDQLTIKYFVELK